MPKYQVELLATAEYYPVTVEAASEEEAYEKAQELVDSGDWHSLTWENNGVVPLDDDEVAS